MNILLDHCVHKKAAKFFVGHNVSTTQNMGWADLSNGMLLAAASEQFDVLVTTDKNLRYQQNLDKLPIAAIELQTLDGRIQSLAKLTPALPEAIELTHTHRFISVSGLASIEVLAKRD